MPDALDKNVPGSEAGLDAPDGPDAQVQISDDELALRVLYAFMQSAAQLAAVFGISLKVFERTAHMAAFHALRGRGLDLNRAAAQLGVSRRKVDQLSRLLKDNFFDRFLAPETSEALQRRIEFILWAQPATAARLKQVIPDALLEEVELALALLVEAGRVETINGRRTTFRITTPLRRLVGDHWLARIDGLNHQLSAVCAAAFGRFFDDDSSAFARTVSFRVRQADKARLETLYREVIWPALASMDEASMEADPGEVEPLILSLCWARADRLEQIPPGTYRRKT